MFRSLLQVNQATFYFCFRYRGLKVSQPSMRKTRAFLLHLALAVPRWLAYLLGFCIPRDQRRWVIGSWDGRRFADNSKWLFLWLTEHRAAMGQLRVTWLTRSPAVLRDLQSAGLPVASTYSLRGILEGYRAGIHIVDADSRGTAFWLAGGARLVNVFHGIALKHIGRDIVLPHHHLSQHPSASPLRRAGMRLLAPWLFERYYAVVASSDENAKVMASAFDTIRPPFVTGLPRNDVLRGSREQIAQWFGKRHVSATKSGGRAIVYMPTFRDSQRSGRSVPLDWVAIHDGLERIDAVMLMKLHPHDSASLPDLSRFPRFQRMDSASDPYLLLRDADALITDYSSVFFDCLLCDIPLFFFAYDLEEYLASDRGMYYDYVNIVPGPVLRTSEELRDALITAFLEHRDSYAEKRRLLTARFHHLSDRPAAALVADALLSTDRE